MARRALLLAIACAVPPLARAADGATGIPSAVAPGLGGKASAVGALPMGYTVEYLVGVALVLVVLAALAYAARRMQGLGVMGRGSLRVESSLPLGGRERLMIVEVEGERLLLGVGAGGVRTLTQLPAREAAPPVELAANGWLARTLRRDAQ